MNKKRRDAITKIIDQLISLNETMTELQDQIDTIQSEEQESFDNLPESLQEAEKGQTMEAAIEALQEASEAVSRACEAIDETNEALESAKGE